MSRAIRSLKLFAESVFIGFAFAIGWILAVVAVSGLVA
jgi:hypothetical protein